MKTEYYEPKIHTSSANIGRLHVIFEGEQFSGLPVLDTKVSVNGETLCWITWDERQKFLEEINQVINKYAI